MRARWASGACVTVAVRDVPTTTCAVAANAIGSAGRS
jgi:hypothetical protein